MLRPLTYGVGVGPGDAEEPAEEVHLGAHGIACCPSLLLRAAQDWTPCWHLSYSDMLSNTLDNNEASFPQGNVLLHASETRHNNAASPLRNCEPPFVRISWLLQDARCLPLVLAALICKGLRVPWAAPDS